MTKNQCNVCNFDQHSIVQLIMHNKLHMKCHFHF